VASQPPAETHGPAAGGAERRCGESHPAPRGSGPGCVRLRRFVAGDAACV